jgi:hypothetical protein
MASEAESGLPIGSRRDTGTAVEPEATPESWKQRVSEVRERLNGGEQPREPFEGWSLPLLLDDPSAWCETHEVLAKGDSSWLRSALVLIPSEDAGRSAEARCHWEHRIKAARRLRHHGNMPGTVAGVLDHGEDRSLVYIVIGHESGTRSLGRSVEFGDLPSPRDSLRLGLALCDILGYLNGLGVHVRDLPLSRIVFKESDSIRLTRLMDPTAVYPVPGVLPEFREGEAFGVEELPPPEPSQIFLVSTLVLALMGGTTEALRCRDYPRGRSASLATLAGRRELADDPPARVAEPLVADLDRRAREFGERIDARRAVEVLRWGLAERRDDRHASLAIFSADLRKALA